MSAAPFFVALIAGLWLRDCVLLASAVLLGLWAFRGGMDGAAPLPVLRFVTRCWAMGWLALLGAALLLVSVAGVMAGLWDEANASPWLAGLSLAGATGLALALDGHRRRRWAPLAIGFALAGVAWLAHAEGAEMAPCLFAIGTAMWAGVNGWRLARSASEGLLEADRLR